MQDLFSEKIIDIDLIENDSVGKLQMKKLYEKKTDGRGIIFYSFSYSSVDRNHKTADREAFESQ